VVDGQSIVPALLGKGKQKPPEYQYWELRRFIAKTETFAVEPPMQALRAGDWKIVRPKPSAPLELYHLGKDPKEAQNLGQRTPGLQAVINLARRRPYRAPPAEERR